jgi:Tfp pilus assembly protein PilN
MNGTPDTHGAAPLSTAPVRRPGLVLPALAAALLALLLTLAVAWVVELQRQRQQAGNDLLQAEISRLDGRIKQVDALRREVEALQGQRKFLETWSAQARWPAAMLRLLAQSRSDGLWFDRVTETAAGLQMRGGARSYGEVERMIVTLGGQPGVGHIELTSLRPGAGTDTIRFAVTATVQPGLRPLTRETLPLAMAAPPKDPP